MVNLAAGATKNITHKMPEKDFEIWINETTSIRIRRVTQSGRLASFSVVLITLHGEEWIDVCRFDTAHGCPHQDIIGKNGGLLQKVWYDQLTPKEVFSLAITKFQNEHERIKSNYFAH